MIAYLVSVSLLITVFIIARALFRKNVSAMLIYCLWSLVLIRLVCPVSIFTLYIPTPAAQPQQETQISQQKPSQNTSGEIKLPQWSFEEEHQGEAASTLSQGKPQQTIAQKGFKLSENLDKLWIAGCLLIGSGFAVSYGRFTANLIKNRRYVGNRGGVKLYRCKGLKSPCLSMSGRSIYLTENENFKGEDMVIEHEMTHREHKDHIWNFVRIAAVTLLWFVPFVWLAAIFSKQDSELACDEAMASKMTYSMRVKYANVLLDAAEQKGIYAVPWGGSPMKERITMITKKHKNRILCTVLVLVMILGAASCSFVGVEPKVTAGDQQTTLDKIPGASGAPTSTAPASSAPASSAPASSAPASSAAVAPVYSSIKPPRETDPSGEWGLQVDDRVIFIKNEKYIDPDVIYFKFSLEDDTIHKVFVGTYQTDGEGNYAIDLKETGRSDAIAFKFEVYFPYKDILTVDGYKALPTRYFEVKSCDNDAFLEIVNAFDKKELEHNFKTPVTFLTESVEYKKLENKGEMTRYEVVSETGAVFYADFPSEWKNDGEMLYVDNDEYFHELGSKKSMSLKVFGGSTVENDIISSILYSEGPPMDWENCITGVSDYGVKYVIYRSTSPSDYAFHPRYHNNIFVLDSEKAFCVDLFEKKGATGDYSNEQDEKNDHEAFLNEVVIPVAKSIGFEK